MRKIVLTFGLIAGAILSLMMVLSIGLAADPIDFERAEILGYTSMVAAFLMIFFGIRAYRDNIAGGTVAFGRAFKVGFLIYLVAAVCYVVSWQVVQRVAFPDFMEKYSAHQIAKARADGESEQQIAEREAAMAKYARWYANPVLNVAITFVEPLPVAILVTLISAGLLSRRRSRSEPQTA